MDKDRSLLFGVLGISLRHFSAEQIQQFTAEWEIEPSQSLPERLLSAGIVTPQVFETLNSITDLVVKVHGGDAGAALRAFGGETTIIAPIDHPTLTDPFFSAEASSLPEVEGVQEFPGRYSDIGEHGRGGFGRVLLVHDSHLDRDIAMKELLPVELNEAPPGTPAPGTDPNTPTRKTLEVVSRFLREARVTSQLEHPSVVPVYELGRRSDGTLYYTMRFVRGNTLSAAFRQRKTLTQRLELLPHFVDLCNAIAYAHSRGIIHRDIKPGNVMVGDFGETAVLDWGLAKSLNHTETHTWELRETMRAMHVDDEEAVTKTLYGRALGTPAYVSPEQALGRLDEIRERSDVYSLGAVLYELLTGRVPYVGITAHDVLEKVVSGPPRPVHEVESQVPPELAAICQKAMAHDSEKRYASAKELADEIQRFLSGALVNAYRYSLSQRLVRYVAKRKAVFATAGAALLILVAVVAASYSRVVSERDKAVVAREMAEERLYETSILLANDEVKRRCFDLAVANLDLAPQKHRNWEWNYLKRKCHQDLLTWRVHTRPIVSADLSPDKKTLLTASYDGTVRIVDLATWQTLHLFTNFSGRLEEVEFSPDGRRILVGCSDGAIYVKDAGTRSELFALRNDGKDRIAHFTAAGNRIFTYGTNEPVRFWDSSTGEELRSFSNQAKDSSRAEVSSDGSRVFIFGKSHSITLFDSESGAELGSIEVPGCRKVAYSSKASRLITVGRDKMVSLWDANSFSLLGALPTDLERTNILALTPDESSVVVAGLPGDVYVFRLNPFELAARYTCHSEIITNISFNTAGTLMATSSTDRTVSVSDLVAGSVVATFEGHSGIVNGAFFLQDERKVLSFSEDESVKVWSLDGSPNAAVFVQNAHKLGLNDGVFSPDGKYVVYLGQDYAAGLWDAKTHETKLELREHKGNVTHAGWSPDSSRFVTASAKSLINHETDSGHALFQADDFAHELRVVRYSPNGDSILVGLADGTIQLRDPANGSAIITFAGGGAELSTALFTPDAAHIVAGYNSGKILIWNSKDGVNLEARAGDNNAVVDLAISPNGSRFVAVIFPSITEIYDTPSGHILRQNQHTVTALHNCAYSPDGKHIAVITTDNPVELLDSDGNPECTLSGHTQIVKMVTFSPDSKRVITASYDSTARIWDINTGKELLCLEGHRDQVSSARFSPDGETIATASWDGDMRFWSGASPNPIDINE
ncbi:MAG: protein kinase [Candidatus Hydrogenedentes bacterium]|nr:protein kinase [Candidatus Hydrogenedentota bacterium]